MRIVNAQPTQVKRHVEVVFTCGSCSATLNVRVLIQGPVVQLPQGLHCVKCDGFPLMKRGKPIEKAPPRVVIPTLQVPPMRRN